MYGHIENHLICSMARYLLTLAAAHNFFALFNFHFLLARFFFFVNSLLSREISRWLINNIFLYEFLTSYIHSPASVYKHIGRVKYMPFNNQQTTNGFELSSKVVEIWSQLPALDLLFLHSQLNFWVVNIFLIYIVYR